MAFYLNEDGSGYYWLEDDSGFLELEDGNPPILVPFIAAATTLYTPIVTDNALARVTQEPVEVLVAPTDALARVTQEPVEVLVLPTDGQVRVTQVPVEVMKRVSYETVIITIID